MISESFATTSLAATATRAIGSSPIACLPARRWRMSGLARWRRGPEGVPVRAVRLPMSAVLRTEATDEKQGFMKALVGADDRILGFTMIGSEAGEVMAAVQTAMLAGLPYQLLRDAVIAHLTMAEGLGPLLSNVPA
jgi:pyruvate/2-oxoglutarate dehydrogenase complex dihydrolipoamide dehydrogenase (E3) component